MQIVIELDEDIIEWLNDGVGLTDYQYKDLIDAITNGVSLPGGHGRLIDADLLSTILTEQYPKNYMNEPKLGGAAAHFSLRSILKIINSGSDTPTIVEADKERYTPIPKDNKCKWIPYDYRTMCPKEHDINNPFWMIPENRMGALKYCPYCGKEIEIEAKSEDKKCR